MVNTFALAPPLVLSEFALLDDSPFNLSCLGRAQICGCGSCGKWSSLGLGGLDDVACTGDVTAVTVDVCARELESVVAIVVVVVVAVVVVEEFSPSFSSFTMPSSWNFSIGDENEQENPGVEIGKEHAPPSLQKAKKTDSSRIITLPNTDKNVHLTEKQSRATFRIECQCPCVASRNKYLNRVKRLFQSKLKKRSELFKIKSMVKQILPYNLSGTANTIYDHQKISQQTTKAQMGP